MGVSKNGNFFVIVNIRNYRTENRNVSGLHEDMSTELTPQSRKSAFLGMSR